MAAEAVQCPNCKLYNPAGSRRCDCGWEFDKSRADQSIPIAPRELNGIRGWLLLFAVGLAYSFALNLIVVLVSVRALPLGETELPPERIRLFLFNLIASAATLAALFPLGVLFLQRSRRTPRLMIIFLVAQLVLMIAGVVLLGQVPGLGTQSEVRNEIVRTVIGGILSAGIWIPYFIVSKRVDTTFTR